MTDVKATFNYIIDNIDAVNCAGSVRRYSAHSRLMRKIKGRSVMSLKKLKF